MSIESGDWVALVICLLIGGVIVAIVTYWLWR
jgi:hypothetical protein